MITTLSHLLRPCWNRLSKVTRWWLWTLVDEVDWCFFHWCYRLCPIPRRPILGCCTGCCHQRAACSEAAFWILDLALMFWCPPAFRSWVRVFVWKRLGILAKRQILCCLSCRDRQVQAGTHQGHEHPSWILMNRCWGLRRTKMRVVTIPLLSSPRTLPDWRLRGSEESWSSQLSRQLM